MQPILVYMSKVDGKFPFSPVSVNFLTELMKVFFAVLMIAVQVSRFFLVSGVAVLQVISSYPWD